jgi:beta-glucosidase
VLDQAQAVLEGFYLGQETGTAVANVLFGDRSPSGKLPVTLPRSVGQLPVYYYQKPSARRGYLFTSNEPLRPFGYGLSYTRFEYSQPTVAPARIRADESARVSVTLSNRGEREGTEVVQLYVHDRTSSVTRPVKLLRDFVRVSLAPGESREVHFELGSDDLSLLDEQMRRVVEPGWFDLYLGGSSEDVKTAELEVVAAQPKCSTCRK